LENEKNIFLECFKFRNAFRMSIEPLKECSRTVGKWESGLSLIQPLPGIKNCTGGKNKNKKDGG
jgi:hypothetical protein